MLGVDGVVAVQRIGNPFFDKIFLGITWLGSETFFLIALGFIFWCVSKRFGIKLMAIFIFSTILNGWLKLLVHTTRPFVLYPYKVDALAAESSFSFPSGHAQGSVVFWGALAARYRKKWVPVAIILVILISLSRVYLGVHYPIDILGGIGAGIGFLLLGAVFSFRKDDNNKGIIGAMIISVAGSGVLAIIARDPDIFKYYSALIGAEIGFMLEEYYFGFSERGGIGTQAIKIIIGLGLAGGVKIGLKTMLPENMVADALRYFLLGLVMTFVTPVLFLVAGLSRKENAGAERESK